MKNKTITKPSHFIFSVALFYIMFSLCLSLFYYNKVEKNSVSFYLKFNKEWSDVREEISKNEFLETAESWRSIAYEIDSVQDPFFKNEKNKYTKSFSDMLNKNVKETIDLIKSTKIKREKEADSIAINDFKNLKTKANQGSLELYIKKVKLLKEKQKEMKYIINPGWLFMGNFFVMVAVGLLVLIGMIENTLLSCNKIFLFLLLVAPAFCLYFTITGWIL